jgi:hypothetical protein
MTLLVSLAVLAVLAIPLAIAIARATELFVLDVHGGSVRVARGRAPSHLLADIRDVVARPPVQAARIRVVVEQGRPRVLATGDLTDAQQQQLRNVVGMWPLAKLRAGRSRR